MRVGSYNYVPKQARVMMISCVVGGKCGRLFSLGLLQLLLAALHEVLFSNAQQGMIVITTMVDLDLATFIYAQLVSLSSCKE